MGEPPVTHIQYSYSIHLVFFYEQYFINIINILFMYPDILLICLLYISIASVENLSFYSNIDFMPTNNQRVMAMHG
jgi:hypothetical protein